MGRKKQETKDLESRSSSNLLDLLQAQGESKGAPNCNSTMKVLRLRLLQLDLDRPTIGSRDNSASTKKICFTQSRRVMYSRVEPHDLGSKPKTNGGLTSEETELCMWQ